MYYLCITCVIPVSNSCFVSAVVETSRRPRLCVQCEHNDRGERSEVCGAEDGRGVDAPGRLVPQQAGDPARHPAPRRHVHLSGRQQPRLQLPQRLPVH